MRAPDGRMLRTWHAGRAKLNGYLEDQAAVAEGLLQLYQTDFDPRWFVAARELADLTLAHFAARDGGFYDTSDDHEALVARPRDLQDGVQPCGGSLAALVLLRLGAYTGDGRYLDAAEQALAPLQPLMAASPLGFGTWLSALDLTLAPPTEVALAGARPDELLAVVRATYRPNVLVAAARPGTRTRRAPSPCCWTGRRSTARRPPTCAPAPSASSRSPSGRRPRRAAGPLTAAPAAGRAERPPPGPRSACGPLAAPGGSPRGRRAKLRVRGLRPRAHPSPRGEVAERLNAAVSKTVNPANRVRGFESPPLRQ